MTPWEENNAASKVHPATREVLPDDPMNLHGFEVPGNGDLMLSVLVEEFARMGWDLDGMMGLARDPFYQGFHGLFQFLGDDELRRRMAEILSRCGVTRVKTTGAAPPPEQLVQLDVLDRCEGSDAHA